MYVNDIFMRENWTGQELLLLKLSIFNSSQPRQSVSAGTFIFATQSMLLVSTIPNTEAHQILQWLITNMCLSELDFAVYYMDIRYPALTAGNNFDRTSSTLSLKFISISNITTCIAAVLLNMNFMECFKCLFFMIIYRRQQNMY